MLVIGVNGSAHVEHILQRDLVVIADNLIQGSVVCRAVGMQPSRLAILLLVYRMCPSVPSTMMKASVAPTSDERTPRWKEIEVSNQSESPLTEIVWAFHCVASFHQIHSGKPVSP